LRYVKRFFIKKVEPHLTEVQLFLFMLAEVFVF